MLFIKLRKFSIIQFRERNPVNIEIDIGALVGVVDIVIPPDLRPFDVRAASAGIGDGDFLLVFGEQIIVVSNAIRRLLD